MGLFLVCGLGVGLPHTYWHRLGDVQVFEGPDRVVLFVEVERAMRWPGLLPRPPWNFAAAFLRIDVFPDGRVERTALQSDLEGHITFNTILYAAVRLADGFYLLENPSYAPRPVYRLGPDRIDKLSSEEVIRATGEDVLHASGDIFDLSSVDAISARRGWRRLPDHWGRDYFGHPIDSTRHGVRLRHVNVWAREDSPESIVAESLPPDNHWPRTLIEVDRRRWRSYKDPADRAYLQARYVASPAR